MTARTWQGKPLTPGVNVDPIDYDAGIRELGLCGWNDGNTRMVIGHALARHARGEEDAAERLAIDRQPEGPHGFGVDFTSWRRILAAAIVKGTEALSGDTSSERGR